MKRYKRAILYTVIAILLFAGLFVLTFRDRRQVKEETHAKVMVMGDSILGECRDETSVTSLLGEMLGTQVFNGALGGTGMSRLSREERPAYTKDGLCMQAFAQSIATKDFGVQQTVHSRESATYYFTIAIDMMETVDFDGLEVLFIEHGINDYHAGVLLENPQNAYDAHTFTGALRSTIKTLQKAYPNLRIVLITPTYSWYPANEIPQLTCEQYDLGGGVLENYVEAEKQVAQEMGVEVLDLYHDFYPHANWSDWEIYTRDGLHPNEEGRKLIARTVYEFLSE